jgi:protein SCO1/2
VAPWRGHAHTLRLPYNEVGMNFPVDSNHLAYGRSVFALLLLLSLTVCSNAPAAKRYELEGRVVAVDPAARQLTIAHQDVPGLMKAMTMPFTVGKANNWIFKSIAPGDHIHATLVLSDHAELQDFSFTRLSNTESDGTSALHVPQPGEEVPDFTLVNQSGKTIHFHQFRGKPLLLTFIYTRCPLPDYCIRMSNNFGQVMQQLQKDPKAFNQAQLLSVSIDPENDKPAVLRSYGEHYVGRVDPSFTHWEFASGSPEQVRQAADFFGLAYNQKDGQIVHSLRTVLIGKDGKVAKVYSGNDWKPDDVAADFIAASGA